MAATRKLPKIAYFWPGLPQLWLRGSWAGLAIAVVFTALVNVLILSTAVFHEWIPLEYKLAGYSVVAACWLVGWWQSVRQTADESASISQHGDATIDGAEAVVGLASGQREQLYRDAQRVYLRGDWVAAEQMLLKLLKLDTRDAESRLMLATLWRRQGRHREALRQLDKLSRLEAGEPWHNEIAVERDRNAAALDEEANPPASDSAIDDTVETRETYNIADAQAPASMTDQTDRRQAA